MMWPAHSRDAEGARDLWRRISKMGLRPPANRVGRALDRTAARRPEERGLTPAGSAVGVRVGAASPEAVRVSECPSGATCLECRAAIEPMDEGDFRGAENCTPPPLLHSPILSTPISPLNYTSWSRLATPEVTGLVLQANARLPRRRSHHLRNRIPAAPRLPSLEIVRAGSIRRCAVGPVSPERAAYSPRSLN